MLSENTFAEHSRARNEGKGLKDNYGRYRAMDGMLVSRTPSLALSHIKHPTGFVFLQRINVLIWLSHPGLVPL